MEATEYASLVQPPEFYHGRPIGNAADRAFQATFLDRLIVHAGYSAQLGSPEQRTAFLDSMTGDQFVGLASSMNRILLNLPPGIDPIADTLNNTLTMSPEGYPVGVADVHPTPEDKIPLMYDVLAAAQSVPDLDTKGLILGVGNNLVHPFDRGNGGVSRGMYHLVVNDYYPSETTVRIAMGHEGRYELFLDPRLVNKAVMDDMKVRLGTHIMQGTRLVAVMPIGVAEQEFFNPLDAAINRQGKEPSNRAVDVLNVLAQADFGTMLPLLVANKYPTAEATQASIHPKTWMSEQFFAIDRFWDNASEAEIEAYYQTFRELKNTIIRNALTQLTLGKDSLVFNVPRKDGKPTSWPVAELAKATVHIRDKRATNLIDRFARLLVDGVEVQEPPVRPKTSKRV